MPVERKQVPRILFSLVLNRFFSSLHRFIPQHSKKMRLWPFSNLLSTRLMETISCRTNILVWICMSQLIIKRYRTKADWMAPIIRMWKHESESTFCTSTLRSLFFSQAVLGHENISTKLKSALWAVEFSPALWSPVKQSFRKWWLFWVKNDHRTPRNVYTKGTQEIIAAAGAL